MQEYKKKTKKGKTTQDVTHRAHMQLLPAVSVRGASKPVFVPDTKNLATWQDESLGYHGL